MAQLVARSVRDAEVVGSSPITLTKMVVFGAWRSLVARTHGVREVRSSNLLAPTRVITTGEWRIARKAIFCWVDYSEKCGIICLWLAEAG